jgi:hypothetical protein
MSSNVRSGNSSTISSGVIPPARYSSLSPSYASHECTAFRSLPVHWQLLIQIPRQQSIQMPRRTRPFVNPVRAVRIGHHREGLVRSDQRVDQRFRPLVMNVVVARAVYDQQLPLQLTGCCASNGVTMSRANKTIGIRRIRFMVFSKAGARTIRPRPVDRICANKMSAISLASA